jgi:hypothetical protein
VIWGALSGLLADVAAAGALAKATLLSLVLTADGKREATDVALHRDIFLAGRLRYMASFSWPAASDIWPRSGYLTAACRWLGAALAACRNPSAPSASPGAPARSAAQKDCAFFPTAASATTRRWTSSSYPAGWAPAAECRTPP